MRRNINRNVYSDRKKCKRDNVLGEKGMDIRTEGRGLWGLTTFLEGMCTFWCNFVWVLGSKIKLD